MSYHLEDWFKIENKILSNMPLDKYEEKIVEDIVISKHLTTIITKKTLLYRARLFDINKSLQLNSTVFHGYDAENSLAPKPEYVDKCGRCNIKGESVLYLAEDNYTALAESRPSKKHHISIAEIELLEDVKLAEFIYLDTNDKNSMFHWICLAFYLVVNFNIESYLITQYIAKKIKEMGFDGIKYSSSLSASGMNIVLFNSKIAKANNSILYLTQSALYYAEEVLPRNNYDSNFRLLPKSITNKFTEKEINYFFERMK